VIVQCTGSPADIIVREAAARHAELVVMCPPPGPNRPLVPSGRLAADVLRMAPCPIVHVHLPAAEVPGSSINCCCPTSAVAIAPAADLTSQAAELVMLQVSNPRSNDLPRRCAAVWRPSARE